jgi:hypothetical protein
VVFMVSGSSTLLRSAAPRSLGCTFEGTFGHAARRRPPRSDTAYLAEAADKDTTMLNSRKNFDPRSAAGPLPRSWDRVKPYSDPLETLGLRPPTRVRGVGIGISEPLQKKLLTPPEKSS